MTYVHAKARYSWLNPIPTSYGLNQPIRGRNRVKSNFLPVIMAMEPFPSKAIMNLFFYIYLKMQENSSQKLIVYSFYEWLGKILNVLA